MCHAQTRRRQDTGSGAQTHMRRLTVKAVRAGLRQTAAAKTHGVRLRAVNNRWELLKSGKSLEKVSHRRYFYPVPTRLCFGKPS